LKTSFVSHEDEDQAVGEFYWLTETNEAGRKIMVNTVTVVIVRASFCDFSALLCASCESSVDIALLVFKASKPRKSMMFRICIRGKFQGLDAV
jgi:hypothetical protein